MPDPVAMGVSDIGIASTLQHDAPWVTPPDRALWDFAGVDGLQAAIALFSPAVSRIAPFQSVETAFQQQPCSVLRLCENNFRVALPADSELQGAIAALTLQVWIKPRPVAVLLLPVSGLTRLREVATTKPIYTLDPFPSDRAVPARVDGRAILAWHHQWQGQPWLEIQTAAENLAAIQKVFSGYT